MDGPTLALILASGAATGLGGLAILVLRRWSERTPDVLLGFTAGVMLAATAFSLLVPALERGSIGEVLLGFGLGAAFIAALDAFVPHAHARFAEHGELPAERRDAQHRAALAAFAALEVAGPLLASGLAFAAGAMLYVIVDELIPESHGHGYERDASIALLVGFALMLALDNAFG